MKITIETNSSNATKRYLKQLFAPIYAAMETPASPPKAARPAKLPKYTNRFHAGQIILHPGWAGGMADVEQLCLVESVGVPGPDQRLGLRSVGGHFGDLAARCLPVRFGAQSAWNKACVDFGASPECAEHGLHPGRDQMVAA